MAIDRRRPAAPADLIGVLPGTLHDGLCRCRACKPPLARSAARAASGPRPIDFAAMAMGFASGVAAQALLPTLVMAAGSAG